MSAWGKAFGAAFGKAWGSIGQAITVRPNGGATPIWWRSNPAGVLPRKDRRKRDEEALLMAGIL